MKNHSISQSITDRRCISMNIYLQEIAKIKLISPEKETELAKRIQNNDRKAIEEMVKANLRFVVSIAKQYRNKGLEMPDLISAGNMGLIKAAERFDEKRGFKFISFAVWWIRRYIMNALNDDSRTIRIPANQINFTNKIRKAAREFEQKNYYHPSCSELSAELGIPEYVIDSTLNSTSSTLSLDEQFSDDNQNTLYDVLFNDDNYTMDNMYNESLKCIVDKMLNLPEIDTQSRDVLKMMFGISCKELSSNQIAEELNIPLQKVYQIKYKAFEKIKSWATNNNFIGEYLS